MYKWVAYFLIWVLTVVSFQLVATKAISDVIVLEIELDWEDDRQTSHVYGVPDL